MIELLPAEDQAHAEAQRWSRDQEDSTAYIFSYRSLTGRQFYAVCDSFGRDAVPANAQMEWTYKNCIPSDIRPQASSAK